MNKCSDIRNPYHSAPCPSVPVPPPPPPPVTPPHYFRNGLPQQVYLKGFYEGVMLVGPCAGDKVCDAKPKIRQELMDKSEAFEYFEPESQVMSR